MTEDFEAVLRALGWFRAGDGTWSTRYVDDNGWPAAPLVLIEPSPAFDAVRALCEYSREQGRREAAAVSDNAPTDQGT